MSPESSKVSRYLCVALAAWLSAIWLPPISYAQQSTILGSATGGVTGRIADVTTVTPGNSPYFIEGGTRTTSNLYHSFGTFNLLGGETAFFRTPGNHASDSGVSNILARVQSHTTIDGILNSKAFYPNARLWIMSPDGISLGTRASFVVGSSINLTTANQLQMKDGSIFYAFPSSTQTSTFTSAAVAAFGFTEIRNTSMAGLIDISPGAKLTLNPPDVTKGQTLAIVAGRIIVGDGVALQSPRARFELATATTGQTVSFLEQDPGTYLQPDNLGNNVFLGNNVTIDGGLTGLVRIGTVTRGPQLNTIGAFSSPTNTIYSVVSTPQFGASKITILPAQVSTVSPNSNTPLEAGEPNTVGMVTVTLNGRAGPAGVTINLQNPDTGVSLKNTQVVVPKDANSATFQMTGIKAGDATITASVPNGTATVPTSVHVNPVPVSNVSLPSLQESDSVNLTVTLKRPTPSDVMVNLNSSNHTVIDVPSSVLIKAGGGTATIPLKGGVAGRAVITASTGGIGVAPVPVDVEVTAFPLPGVGSLSPMLSIPPNTNGALTVTLKTASPRDVTVALTSSNTAVATLQPSVVVPAGSLVSPPINVHGGTAGTATITASVSTSSASTTVQVFSPPPPPAPQVKSVSPTGPFQVGTVDTLTVTLTTTSSTPVTVALASSNSSVAAVNNSVVVPAGHLSTAIPVQGLATGTSTISASVLNSSASTPVVVTGAGTSAPSNVIAAGQVQGLTETQSQGNSQNPQNPRIALPFSYTNQLTLALDRCAGAKEGEFSSFAQRGRDRVPSQPGEFLSSPLSLEGETVEVSGLSFQTSGIAGRRSSILNLAPGVAAFLELNRGC